MGNRLKDVIFCYVRRRILNQHIRFRFKRGLNRGGDSYTEATDTQNSANILLCCFAGNRTHKLHIWGVGNGFYHRRSRPTRCAGNTHADSHSLSFSF